MAGGEYPFGFAVFALRQGLSARAGLASYRQAGGKVADSTWYRMIGEAKAHLATRGKEVYAPLGRRPTVEEMTTWTTRTARGFAQQVGVIVRDRDTGLVETLPYTLTSSRLVSRASAIDSALSHITPEGTDGERQQILGAVYLGTMQMIPEE